MVAESTGIVSDSGAANLVALPKEAIGQFEDRFWKLFDGFIAEEYERNPELKHKPSVWLKRFNEYAKSVWQEQVKPT